MSETAPQTLLECEEQVVTGQMEKTTGLSGETLYTPTKRSNGEYNRAALRRHALKVSEEDRLGKFTRVSEEFLNTVEANVESFMRSLRREITTARLKQVDPAGESFLTGAGERKLIEAFNIWVAREIHRQVNRVPCGKTL